MNKKALYILPILLIGLFVIFKPLLDKKFYGFEYEDSFVNPHIASQKNISPFLESYRTMGCETFENGTCKSVASYTGHYATYAIYLFSINKIFNIQQNHFTHKIGNAILFIICFLFVFYLYKDTTSLLTLYVGLISCLPVIYVFNSGLIENISFSLGFMLMVSLYKLKFTKKNCWLILYLLLLLLLINIKRENLIYASTIVILDPKKLLKNYIFWIGLGIIIISQAFINPFYTEGLESSYLGKSTFSYDYFKFQFPTYFASFFRIDGFLIITLIIFFLIKPSKESFTFLAIWLIFLLSYSFHYRGQYAIAAGKITHFETFRYMFNTLPLLIGYFLFGDIRKKINMVYPLIISIVIGIFLTYSNTLIIEEFALDELNNYHAVNDKINSIKSTRGNIAIHDNFTLISMLNSASADIDIYSANNNDITFADGKENLLINRFKILNLDNFKNLYTFQLIDSLSTNSTPVYSFNKVFEKNEVK
jgi:hypothetical protein